MKIGGDLLGGGGAGSGSFESLGSVAVRTIQSVAIGGSVIGGGGEGSAFFSTETLGPVKIGGDLRGGSATDSGEFGGRTVASIHLGGSVIGGSSDLAGSIFADVSTGPISIGKNLAGGSGLGSGHVDGEGSLGAVTIGGSVLGGSGDDTGTLFGRAGIGPVNIRGDLIGGSMHGNGVTLTGSGFISSDHRIASVTVGGSIIAGHRGPGDTLVNSGAIRAGDDRGPVLVKGSILGNTSNPVSITARGQAAPTGTSDVAMANLTVGGQVTFASILAGYDTAPTPINNGNAQIGAVKVGGDWIASNLVAGVQDNGADGFGNGNEIIIGGGASIAKIASIVIGGSVAGTGPSGDNYGFESHEIGSFQAAGSIAPLTAGPSGDVVALSPATGDVTIREI